MEIRNVRVIDSPFKEVGMGRRDPVARREYDLAYYAAHRLPEGVAKKLPETNTHCKVDGLLMRRHSKCRGCHILMGPGHLEKTIADRCPSCVKAGVEWRKSSDNGEPYQANARYRP